MKKTYTRMICVIIALVLCLSAAGCTTNDKGTSPIDETTEGTQAEQDNNGVTVRGNIRHGDKSVLGFSTFDKSSDFLRDCYEEAENFFRRYSEIHFQGAKITDEEDDALLSETVYTCNDEGKGIAFFVPPDSTGMNQRCFIFARTNDRGETWDLLPYSTYTSYYFSDVKVVGDDLFMLCTNSVTLDNFLIYSRDFLDTWEEIYFQNDHIEDEDNLFVYENGYLSDLTEFSEFKARFISVDGDDPSVIIGMYDDLFVAEDKCLFMFELGLDEDYRQTKYRTLYKDETILIELRDKEAKNFAEYTESDN